MQLLSQFLRQEAIDDELTDLIATLMVACKEITLKLRQGAISGVLGTTADINVQGETQKKLDVISNEIIKKYLSNHLTVAGLASEEESEAVIVNPNGKYLVVFDPLDGSSNIDINVTVGTIFSILEANPAEGYHDEVPFLQNGRKQLAAGYVLYGPSAQLVLTTGNGVSMFTLSETGDFLLTHEKVTIPEETQEFAINMSNYRHWEPAMRSYVDDLLEGVEGARGKNFNMRWVAAMVAEVHRVLTRGGIFIYPWDKRVPQKPGKLRLMYEGNPMSMLIEQAGGLAKNCYTDILDVEPKDIHERVSVAMGSKKEVEVLLEYHQKIDTIIE